MPRGGTREAKEQAIKAIRDRQELIEETGEFNPFLIFQKERLRMVQELCLLSKELS